MHKRVCIVGLQEVTLHLTTAIPPTTFISHVVICSHQAHAHTRTQTHTHTDTHTHTHTHTHTQLLTPHSDTRIRVRVNINLSPLFSIAII